MTRRRKTKKAAPVKVRCAVYTRKSVAKGLEQEFNSLDAQREACEQYVIGQARQGWELEIPENVTGFQAGELVTCTVPPHLPHIMVVSDKKSDDGVPLVIHNIGGGAKEEDRLGDFEITGRYRVKE